MSKRGIGLPLLLGATAAIAGAFPAQGDAWAPLETGWIEGRVTIGEELKPRRMRFNLYPDLLRETRAGFRNDVTDERRNVVVYVESAPVPLDHDPGNHVMEQRGGRFLPHVLPVMRGARVAFPNSDPMFHNVFSLSRAASFDLGRFPRDEVREVDFNTPGVVQVFCHIHSDMSAAILVLDNPFFAVPDAEGRFRIDGLPPGDYVVRAWHERAEPGQGRLRVQPGLGTAIDFHVPLSEATHRDR